MNYDRRVDNDRLIAPNLGYPCHLVKASGVGDPD